MSSWTNKYAVQFMEPDGTWQNVTRYTTRSNAQALALRLGPGYRVWNRYTRQVSYREEI